MSPWSVRLTAEAVSDLAKLDPAVASRVIRRLKQSLSDPFRDFERLRGGKVGWKLRVGDWRLLARLDDSRREIEVDAVGHRSTVYDR